MRIIGYHSTTKAMHYRSLLHNVWKNELSMSAYLAEIKHRCDSLVGCGQRVTMEEQQYTILNGLPPEFDHMVSIITTSRAPTALLDVQDLNVRSVGSLGILLKDVSTGMIRHPTVKGKP
ncbi:hypothetical protein Goari_016640 [Gossypium aridum]|uniref:Uncharacterized protein n=1 Tax=Gossypium aridum TaxID=34290 RepID=A0A7J8WJ64_GOSAI|nr:hypothetical protein [Gossypium aridum]